MVTHAINGMVATSQPLAAQAGLAIMQNGGNAVDAAIAAAACLTVVEPTSNGIGSDAFAIVWIRDNLYGLNASGPTPAGISIPALKARGLTEIPEIRLDSCYRARSTGRLGRSCQPVRQAPSRRDLETRYRLCLKGISRIAHLRSLLGRKHMKK